MEEPTCTPSVLRRNAIAVKSLPRLIPLVRGICQRHGLSSTRVRLTPGLDRPIFFVDCTHVVKLYPHGAANTRRREVLCYSCLGGPENLVPQLLASGSVRDSRRWRYIILEYRPGIMFGDISCGLSPASMRGVAERLAATVHGIHAADVSGSIEVFPDWPSFLQRQVGSVHMTYRHRCGLSDDVSRDLARYVEQRLPDPTDPRCLINADLTGENLLLARRDGRFVPVALVDFGDAEYGHREYEWVALCLGMFDSNPMLIGPFFKSYNGSQIDRRWREQMLAWTLVHRYGPEIVLWALAGRPDGLGGVRGPGSITVRHADDLLELLWPSSLDNWQE